MARPKGRQLPNRVSVALTDDQFTALESIAQENQAAVAWVVRRAVVEFLDRSRVQPVPQQAAGQVRRAG